MSLFQGCAYFSFYSALVSPNNLDLHTSAQVSAVMAALPLDARVVAEDNATKASIESNRVAIDALTHETIATFDVGFCLARTPGTSTSLTVVCAALIKMVDLRASWLPRPSLQARQQPTLQSRMEVDAARAFQQDRTQSAMRMRHCPSPTRCSR
jgi:hypothetical protein